MPVGQNWRKSCGGVKPRKATFVTKFLSVLKTMLYDIFYRFYKSIFSYLLHFKKIFIDDKEIIFTLEDFVKLAKPKSEIKNEEEKAFTNQSIF